MSYLLSTVESEEDETIVLPIVELNNMTQSSYLLDTIETEEEDTTEEDNENTSLVYVPDLKTRTLKVTVETLLKNIASYNYKTDMTDRKYHIKTYILEDGKQILVTVDMRDSKNIIYKISGDTGYDKVLIKQIVITDNEITTTYLEGEDNAS